jgi:hypothetical protein
MKKMSGPPAVSRGAGHHTVAASRTGDLVARTPQLAGQRLAAFGVLRDDQHTHHNPRHAITSADVPGRRCSSGYVAYSLAAHIACSARLVAKS